jgi:hypothetical protein
MSRNVKQFVKTVCTTKYRNKTTFLELQNDYTKKHSSANLIPTFIIRAQSLKYKLYKKIVAFIRMVKVQKVIGL